MQKDGADDGDGIGACIDQRASVALIDASDRDHGNAERARLAVGRAVRRALTNIERTDRLVQLIAAQYGMKHPVVDQTVAQVDARLEANRKKAAA